MSNSELRQNDAPHEIKNFVTRLSPIQPLIKKQQAPFPKISIVIPSFNQGIFLERTLLSIINQNYPEFEIVIIDGGSTDDTISIINKYEQYISYWVSEKDHGQSHALNKGFARATGEIFAWQNSDDIYLPDAFYRIANVLIEYPETTVCYGNWYSIDENDDIIAQNFSLKPRTPHSPYENMDAYNQTIFWRKEVHNRFGEFDENLDQKMDCDMIVRFLLNEGPARFFRISAFLGAFRSYEAQKTFVSIDNKKFLSEEVYMEKKFNFKSSSSFHGKYYRLKYRFAQLFESLIFGGACYTWEKFLKTYRERGQFF
ncbi:MAG: glycosyltransferase [Desulfobacterales bacterium]|nr:glycosyltransferase [Desulfobacterales bacterium]